MNDQTQAENTEKNMPQKQGEMPFAIVQGEPMAVLPEDLYIPPDALEVFLDTFEGPLDLLLYLIKRQNLDILDIPIAGITRQYMEYIDMMEEIRFELAAEYLVMAAMLAEIKSRMLLPRPESIDEEDDPRAELIRRLQEYERFKQAAENLDEIPRLEREIHLAHAESPPLDQTRPEPEVDLRELLLAFKELLSRADKYTHHQISREPLSIRERMSNILAVLEGDSFTDFVTLFKVEEGRRGIVVTFMALLELLKESLIDLVQSEHFAPIYVKAATALQVESE